MSVSADGKDPLVFIIAGEHSGDLLGGRLMAALKEATGGHIRFAGVGGVRMTEQGLNSLFPISELAVYGLFSILRHIPRLLRLMREVVASAIRLRPVVVITVDAPDFTLRIAKRLRGQHMLLVHYVAPTVWAWKPGRARKIAQYLNRLLVVLPFEPPYFEVHGLHCDFVGHPVVEAAITGNGPAFRARHGIPADAPLLCAMPGSRGSEITRLMPVYRETVIMLAAKIPGLHIVIPTVDHVNAAVTAACADWPVPVTLVHEAEEKHDAFAAASVALVKSGTTSIEMAVEGLPCVITQRIGWFSAWIARRMLRIEHFSIINLLLKRRVQPELIQEDCTPEKLSAALLKLFEDPQARQEQIEAGRLAARMLGQGDEAPSHRAARAVLRAVEASQIPV